MKRTIDDMTGVTTSSTTNGHGPAHRTTDPETKAQLHRSNELNDVISILTEDEASASAATSGALPESSKVAKRSRSILIVSAAIVLLLGSAFALRYWLNARLYESTDDAFIEGRTVEISPKVSGYVKKIYVTDNQEVHEGDLLVEIDPVDYEAKVDEARAALNTALARHRSAQTGVSLTTVTSSAVVEQANARLDAAGGVVEQAHAQAAAAQSRAAQAEAGITTAKENAEQAEAQIVAAQAEAERASADVERFRALYAKDDISRRQLEQAIATARTADAQLEAARRRAAAAHAQVSEATASRTAAMDQIRQSQAQILTAQAQVGESKGRLSEARSAPQQIAVKQSEVETASAEIERAQAALRQAELNLSYTKIYAPQVGRVTRKNVEQGALLDAGQALFAIVPAEMWVIANFKEIQLDRMHPGQPVAIRVDAYPDKSFSGHIDSLQTGTGSRFSLLPPENATGNYVKVVQRVPVKIVFDETPDPAHSLAPGMSVVPEVKVR
jgi:membrane fusion protein (multidrug efflux system)